MVRLAALLLVLGLTVLPSAAAAGDRVVARVGKIPITHLEVLALMADRRDLTYSQAVDSLVDRSLVLAWAGKRGMSVPDRDVDSAIASLRKRDSLNQEQFEKALAAEGLNLEGLRARVRDQILVNQALSAGIADRLAVSDEQIEEGYRQQFPPLSTLTVSHILLRLPADASGEEAARREQEAASLLARIRAGLSFADAARESSEDASSAAKGGNLGTFSPGELMPELDKAAQTLSPGEVAGPVRTGLGFHLLTVTDRTTTVPPLEKVRSQVVSRLQAEKERPAREAWIAELRREFYVEAFPSEE